MQIAKRDVLVGEAQRVAVVLLGLEIDGDFAHIISVDNGVILTFFREIDLGAVCVQLELANTLPLLPQTSMLMCAMGCCASALLA